MFTLKIGSFVLIMYQNGDKIDRLTILKKIDTDHYLCRCECGKEVTRTRSALRYGAKLGCGCITLIKKYNLYIKVSDKFIYQSYNAMKSRCNNPKDISYPNYGGRGIKICDEWMDDFGKFYQWSIENGAKAGLSIDRIDVNGNYDPSNCRWATRIQQARNTRVNRFIIVDGEKKCLQEWAELIGIEGTSLSRNLKKDTDYIKKKLNGTAPKRINHHRAVLQYDLNGNLIKEHKSIKAAAEYIGSHYDAINGACRRNTHRHKDYLWYFGELKYTEID